MYPKKRVRQIRILPTSSSDYDFEDEEAMKNFFTQKLPSDAKFHFYKNNVADPEGTLILFQYNNAIVASGIMEDRIDTMEKGYNGYYLFKKSSINLLTTPISKDELKDADVGFERFGNTAAEIKIKYFREINNLLDDHFED
ncbi:hypothetical protein [Methanobrevibacter sp.]|uniref:hypothetical protein n=1 Tax=Methanobrevibacter sp. TaxID=66852 RepID=UPI0025EDA28D|nr:hypothetical protein [Methanobrevibacter sp.]MBQ2962722.1 hypothetical protein [Methanobrevibacter sp.]